MTKVGVSCYIFHSMVIKVLILIYQNQDKSFKTVFSFVLRYGGDLVLIGDYSQNNFTSKVASKSLRDLGEISYWIGKYFIYTSSL